VTFTSVFINGTSGVGKSTTLQALGAILAERALPHAMVDFDYLQLAWPAPADDPFNLRLGLRNLTDVAANYRAAGAERLALAHVLTNRDDADAFSRAIGAERMLVCRLRAEPQTIEARLRQRHGSDAPWELPWFLERFKALQDELDAAAIDDVVVNIDDKSPTAVAHEVLAAAGW
jgi:energy-coupling factor transporter ATP-binding protein EcfA2